MHFVKNTEFTIEFRLPRDVRMRTVSEMEQREHAAALVAVHVFGARAAALVAVEHSGAFGAGQRRRAREVSEAGGAARDHRAHVLRHARERALAIDHQRSRLHRFARLSIRGES